MKAQIWAQMSCTASWGCYRQSRARGVSAKMLRCHQNKESSSDCTFLDYIENALFDS